MNGRHEWVGSSHACRARMYALPRATGQRQQGRSVLSGVMHRVQRSLSRQSSSLTSSLTGLLRAAGRPVRLQSVMIGSRYDAHMIDLEHQPVVQSSSS